MQLAPEASDEEFEQLAKIGAINLVQGYDDNANALQDYVDAKDAARILNAEDFGPDDCFDINKDP